MFRKQGLDARRVVGLRMRVFCANGPPWPQEFVNIPREGLHYERRAASASGINARGGCHAFGSDSRPTASTFASEV
jgi:hypothetical protein